MKKSIKIIGYSFLAVLFSIALSGCGKKTAVDPNANKLIVWSFEDEDAWKSIKKSFESSNKGYTLVYQKQILDSTYENRVLNSILSGQGPDVWSMPNDWVYRHKEKLAPMPAKLGEIIKIDNFVPAVKQSVFFDNNVYALAPSVEPLMVYYNPKLFSKTYDEIQESDVDEEIKKSANTLLESPPALWSDLVKTANLLTKKEGGKITVSGLALGTENITNSIDILYLLMLQNSTDILSSDGKLATFNLSKEISTGTKDIPGQRAIDFYTSFANPASSNYTWDDSLGNDIEAFANGKLAMIFGFSNLQNTLLQKYPTINYKKDYAPQLYGDADKITDFARFNAFGVSALSKNSALGWNLLSGLVSDYQDDLNSFSRLYTSKRASEYNKVLSERDGSNPEKLSLGTAQSLVKGRYPYEFDKNLKEAISAINSKSQDSLSALDLAASKSTELLRKEVW